MRKTASSLFVVMALIIFPLISGAGQSGGKKTILTGSIRGKLQDRESKISLPGADVLLAGETSLIGVTDENGMFYFNEIPVGSYSLTFTVAGMLPIVRTDIVVKSGAATRITAEIDLTPVANETVRVVADSFRRTADEPATVISFSHEEIRRAPGAGGDVNRIIAAMPSIARTNDQANNLAVRGGSSMENLFLVDNIEIPNINHFPIPGSSSGPICLLNLDLIRDVDFHAGGFSAAYGDRLSSVMNLSLREGDRDRLHGQVSLDMAGIGLLGEGPLPGKKGSWIIAVRRSYLDLLTGMLDAGAQVRYGDLNTRLDLELSSRSRFTLLGIMGDDHSTVKREDAVRIGESVFGSMSSNEGTWGGNWFWMPHDKIYFNTSIAFTSMKNTGDWLRTVNGEQQAQKEMLERYRTLRHTGHWSLAAGQKLNFGLEFKQLQSRFNYTLASTLNPLGEFIPEVHQKISVSSVKYAFFAEYSASLFSRLTLNLGVRGDGFDYTRRFSLSPRFSCRWDLSSKSSLGMSAGLYRQTLPLLLLYRHESNRSLADPLVRQYAVDFRHIFGSSLRLTVEAYSKDYRHLPIDPRQPSLCILDDLFGESLFGDAPLEVSGRGQSYGVEVVLQKKLKEKIYGLVSGSYFRSRYRDPEGAWRNRIYDNRFVFSVQGGYKPNRLWEFSLSWILAGGIPYTPFDLEASREVGRGIFDPLRINEERLPAYHSLSLRADRRFFFRRSYLVFYASLWNAYNRNNIAASYWNEVENRAGFISQFGILPVIGIEFEF